MVISTALQRSEKLPEGSGLNWQVKFFGRCRWHRFQWPITVTLAVMLRMWQVVSVIWVYCRKGKRARVDMLFADRFSSSFLASPTLLDACCLQEIPSKTGLTSEITRSGLSLVSVPDLNFPLHLLSLSWGLYREHCACLLYVGPLVSLTKICAIQSNIISLDTMILVQG